jgi:hypothetical protein
MVQETNLVAELVGPYIDPGLKIDTPIYRIVDFFAAANLIETGNLYIPLASKFHDPNEGIESAITVQSYSSGPCAGVVGRFRSLDEFLSYQKFQRNCNYVSCWTKERESVAMWALYSPDYTGVQLETTVQGITNSTATLAKNLHNPISIRISPDQQSALVLSVDIFSVKYPTLSALLRRIDRRRRAFEHLYKSGKTQKPDGFLGLQTRRAMQRAKQIHFAKFSIKDSSFSHEREVRVVINAIQIDHSIQQEVADHLSKFPFSESKGISYDDRDKLILEIARGSASEASRKKRIELPDHMYLRIEPESVLSVTIDPRCPPHKQTFMKKFFESHAITIRESRCFGHAAQGFPILPRQSVDDRR